MRITFVLPSLRICGGVKSTFELANRLQDRGHKVCVVYPLVPSRSGRKWHTWIGLARKLKRTDLKLAEPNRVDWFDLRANLMRTPTLSSKYVLDGDIVVATWWANAFDVSDYPDKKGKKFHMIRSYETWGGPKELVDRSYTLPLQKIAISTGLIDIMKSEFGVSVIGPLPNGVDFSVFHMERDFTAHQPRRVGILYRNIARKGSADGLLAFAMARKRYPDIKLVLFGEVPSRKNRNMISQLSPVEHHESPVGEELRTIYNSLDIFLFPSHLEGFGNPPIEAMACGAACITTDVGAVPDYTINGETALCVPPRQPEKLAEALIGLLVDEKRRQHIAKSGHQHVQRFTWEGTVDELETVFRESLGE